MEATPMGEFRSVQVGSIFASSGETLRKVSKSAGVVVDGMTFETLYPSNVMVDNTQAMTRKFSPSCRVVTYGHWSIA
jgi:hypothetical protein